MFNAEITRACGPTVGIEAPGQGGCLDDDVAAYVAGLRNLLAWRASSTGRSRPARRKLPVAPPS